jgi:hypothetical protein
MRLDRHSGLLWASDSAQYEKARPDVTLTGLAASSQVYRWLIAVRQFAVQAKSSQDRFVQFWQRLAVQMKNAEKPPPAVAHSAEKTCSAGADLTTGRMQVKQICPELLYPRSPRSTRSTAYFSTSGHLLNAASICWRCVSGSRSAGPFQASYFASRSRMNTFRSQVTVACGERWIAIGPWTGPVFSGTKPFSTGTPSMTSLSFSFTVTLPSCNLM